MKSPEEYVESLSARKTRVFIRGKEVPHPSTHPLVAPSVRTVAETYRLAQVPEHRPVFVARSRFIDDDVSRFTHIFETPDDLQQKQEMQRIVGRVTGTCFQRCVGMDALNALYNVTYEMDAEKGGESHERFLSFLKHVQREDLVVCGAMTDAKGDRRKRPREQPSKFVRIVGRDSAGIRVSGVKMHQTGIANSHEILLMPGGTLQADEADFAVACAIPVDAPGVTLVLGRTPSDDRRLQSALDQGNARYGGQEAVLILDEVEVAWERVFLCGETQWTTKLVDDFAHHHRHSYGGCKPGNGEVLIGAAALAAEMAGVNKASHVRDKLVEMVHLNETMYACGVACAARCRPTAAGTVMVDPLLANVTKQHVTRLPYEMGRLAEDLAGGLMVTMPSSEDLDHPEIGPTLREAVECAPGGSHDRARILRLIESMTLGCTAVPLRTEAMHGAGSPQAQRVRMEKQADFDGMKARARWVAGITPEEDART